MIRLDLSELPLIDAVSLFARLGVEAVADVALPDETLPINGQWRIDLAEWETYRRFCGTAEQVNRRAA